MPFARLLRSPRLRVAVGLGASTALATAAKCHGNHTHDRVAELEERLASLEARYPRSQTTGQNGAVFSWSVELTDAFPEAARPFEKDMHGGFNEDSETGVVYTGIPGYGLCSISPDLKTWTKLGTDERLEANIHGLIFFKHGSVKRLALAQNEAQRVLIVALDGTVLQELGPPKGGEFDFSEANGYYSNKRSLHDRELKRLGQNVPDFKCTDVTYLDGKLYVVTGYCAGDFVLSAHCDSTDAAQWKWGPVAWGGKGETPGRFQTAHGIFAHDGSLFVANREAHQVLEFTPDGKLVRCLPDIPTGARICNMAHAQHDGYFVMNALEPIRHSPAKTAPIYAHSGEKLLSIIEPGELGIPVLKHLHNVWPHYVMDAEGNRTLYLLMHGWSAGKFAVLKHEPSGLPSSPHYG